MNGGEEMLAAGIVAEATIGKKRIQWQVAPPQGPGEGTTVRMTLGQGSFLAGAQANPGSRVRAADELAVGTLGCWFSVADEKGFFFLTSEHIFKEINNNDLIQFSRNGVSWADGASVVRKTGIQWDDVNDADAVVGALSGGATAGLDPLCADVRFSSRTLPADDAVTNRVEVAFCGAISKPGSQVARGRVVARGNVQLVQGRRKATFKDQLFVEAVGANAGVLAAPGDSGSLVVVLSGTHARKPVGLLIGWFVEAPGERAPEAGEPEALQHPVYYYVVTPIETVLKQLRYDPNQVTILG